MQEIFNLDIDDYIEICQRAYNDGLKSGESMIKYVREYCKEKNLKSSFTELNKNELINEIKSKGNNILDLTNEE